MGRLSVVPAWMVFLFIIIILSGVAKGARISGTVFDYTLSPVSNAVVSINTSPRQQMIAQNATFLFELSPGAYMLSAKSFSGNRLIASYEEELTVRDNGIYVMDLILFPNLEDDEELFEDLNVTLPEVSDITSPHTSRWYYWIIPVVGFALVASFLAYRYRKRLVHHTKDDAVSDDIALQVLTLIKKHHRISQRDIRREVPVSEAKISLVLAELEAKGAIKKIKKGRGNIIVLA